MDASNRLLSISNHLQLANTQIAEHGDAEKSEFDAVSGKMPPYRSSALSLEDELMRRIAESEVDLSNAAVKRYADSLIASTKMQMANLLTDFTRSQGTITIKLDNYRSTPKKQASKTSEVIYVFGLPWQVEYSFTPLDQQNYTLNLFLCYLDGNTKTCQVEADFVMKDQRDGPHFVRSLSYTFKPFGQFGFRYFAYKNEIENPKLGYLQNDSLIIEVTVRVAQSAAEEQPVAGLMN